MVNDIYETYISDMFPDMWECRNKQGWMIGCGSSKEAAELDTKTYDEIDVLSYNMKKEGF